MEQYLSNYKGKNILITGGAGCIGSNLTKALIKAEAGKIIVLDDLSAAEKWNIPVAPNVDFIEGSVVDDEALQHGYESDDEQPDDALRGMPVLRKSGSLVSKC